MVLRTMAPEVAQNRTTKLNRPVITWGWDQAGYLPDWHEPIFSLMARYVASGSKVLEVGAGGSHTLAALAGRLNCQACGVDPDVPGLLSTSKQAGLEGKAVSLIRGDGFWLPFADNYFDVVYSLGLIEHFRPRESQELVMEHTRVCKTGGIVIISVPNLYNLPHTFRKFILGEKYPYHPERSYTLKELRVTLTSAGLRLIAVDGMLPLWGVGMVPGGWRLIAALDRLGALKKVNQIGNPKWRALCGYMTYVVAEKEAR
ncbi:MAG: class I SAM-dependent methyltransferase [Blastocatellia bacterium]